MNIKLFFSHIYITGKYVSFQLLAPSQLGRGSCYRQSLIAVGKQEILVTVMIKINGAKSEVIAFNNERSAPKIQLYYEDAIIPNQNAAIKATS